MTWKDDAARGWDLLSWQGEAQWFAKQKSGITLGGRLYSCDQLLRSIDNAEHFGWNFYLNLNPTRGGRRYATRADVSRWRYACLDLDPAGDVGSAEHAESHDVPCVDHHWAKGACVFTGRGWQFWLPVYDMPEPPDWAEVAMRQLLRATSVEGWLVDPCTSDLPRRVRCPGSINQRTGRRAQVVAMPQGSWAPVEPEIPPEQPREIADLTNASLYDALASIKICNVAAFKFVTEGKEHPGRRAALFTFIKTMSELGIDRSRAYRWGLIGAEKCRPREVDPGFWPKEVARVVRQVYGR